MTYEEAIKYIHSIPKFSRVLGNDMLGTLLHKLKDPQDKLKYIHIGGTNGKGSTCTMLSEILISSGYKVGLFTSPFLVQFNERIRIDGVPIPNDKLTYYVENIKTVSESENAPVSEFAFDTAVAFQYFCDEECDIVILEVGLGGRLDATNVIKTSEAVGIVSIGLDHCQYLGDTIDEISREKLGIVKRGNILVLGAGQDKIVYKNAANVCKTCGAEYYISSDPQDYDKTDRSFFYKGTKYILGMDGSFQAYNAAVAIEISQLLRIKGYNITDENIKFGLKNAKIGCRMEYLAENLLVDGAHNPPAIAELLKSLMIINKKTHMVTAIMQDKDYKKVAETIASFAKSHSIDITCCEIDMPRCLSAESYAEEFSRRGINAAVVKDPVCAVKNLIQDKNSLTCVCGSIYLAGSIKGAFGVT